MGLIKVDLSEAAEPLTAGVYKARVVDCKTEESRDGKPRLNWRLEVYGASNPGHNGRSIFHRTPLTGKGVFRLQELYQAATREQLTKDNPEFDTEQIMGREVEVTLVDGRDRDGNPSGYPDVKAVRAAAN